MSIITTFVVRFNEFSVMRFFNSIERRIFPSAQKRLKDAKEKRKSIKWNFTCLAESILNKQKEKWNAENLFNFGLSLFRLRHIGSWRVFFLRQRNILSFLLFLPSANLINHFTLSIFSLSFSLDILVLKLERRNSISQMLSFL
jgi:hypothetical protein